MSFLNQPLGLMFLLLPLLKSAFIVLKGWEENCSFRRQSCTVFSFPENQIHSIIFQVLLLLFPLVKVLHTLWFCTPSAKPRQAPGVILPFTVLFTATSARFCSCFSSLVTLLGTSGFYVPSTRKATQKCQLSGKSLWLKTWVG